MIFFLRLFASGFSLNVTFSEGISLNTPSKVDISIQVLIQSESLSCFLSSNHKFLFFTCSFSALFVRQQISSDQATSRSLSTLQLQI